MGLSSCVFLQDFNLECMCEYVSDQSTLKHIFDLTVFSSLEEFRKCCQRVAVSHSYNPLSPHWDQSSKHVSVYTKTTHEASCWHRNILYLCIQALPLAASSKISYSSDSLFNSHHPVITFGNQGIHQHRQQKKQTKNQHISSTFTRVNLLASFLPWLAVYLCQHQELANLCSEVSISLHLQLFQMH